ncbi:MBL fold metallo-hydrolase [Streptomyces sp. NBC_00846]|uniref:MBL fold metallo-hydrolase n=1 Tax=Streptomyces sp. NBC_00846 TaxID=2975849 RepID=UPI00386F951F|nr:MBL fold metallo-hydrolase [Streptomyces sp. NBC_00846]
MFRRVSCAQGSTGPPLRPRWTGSGPRNVPWRRLRFTPGPAGSGPSAQPHYAVSGARGSGARVVHSPGHTPGSIGVHLPHHGVLFTGDCVAAVDRVMLGVLNIDRTRALASFRRLAALEPATACFGHGDPLTVDAAAVLRASADRDSGLQVEHG